MALDNRHFKGNIFGYEVMRQCLDWSQGNPSLFPRVVDELLMDRNEPCFVTRFSVTNTWSILQTSGALVQGGYGHSSVYDPNTRSIYIHGGYKAFSANKYRLADDLYKYEVDSRMW